MTNISPLIQIGQHESRTKKKLHSSHTRTVVRKGFNGDESS